MKRWKWCMLGAIAVVLTYESVQIFAQTQLQRLMADKLQNAQKILEGIAVADFDKTSHMNPRFCSGISRDASTTLKPFLQNLLQM